MTEENNNIMLFPAWKQAVENFIKEDFCAEDIITHEWLHEHFGLEKPDLNTPKGKADQIEIAYMKYMSSFKEYLLSEHKILLVSKPGVGYRYIPTEGQTEYSEKTMFMDVRKALKKGITRIVNTNLNLLDSEQKRQHSDALVRSAGLKTLMNKKRRRLPWKDDDTQ